MRKLLSFLFLNIAVFAFLMEGKAESQEYYFSYTGDVQEFVAPENGYYKIEAWGAGGGRNRAQGSLTNGSTRDPGYGAYTSGVAYLSKGQKIYIYVGGKGANGETNTIVPGGWNGGGRGDYDHSDDESAGSGGGATDIRLIRGEWDDFESLKSRVMVAGGGGGSAYTEPGGSGGTLTGGNTYYSTGGTQTSGYAFGKGQDGVYVDDNVDVAGGGGGYYGGYANSSGGSSVYRTSGAGGSSFVSGCNGCNAISKLSTENNLIHSGLNTHYSRLVFSDIVMLSGNDSMPNYDGTGNITGNSDDGYVRITTVENKQAITNITLDGAISMKKYEYSPYDYVIYLKPNHPSTGTLNLELLGNPENIIGYQNIKIETGRTANITLTHPNGEIDVYTVTFEEQKAHLDSLKFDYLKLPDFHPLNYSYEGSVPYNIKNLNPVITVSPGVTYEITGNTNLKIGENEITITVHEEGLPDGVYHIKVNREEYIPGEQKMDVKDFSYTGEVQEFIAPKNGLYKLEVWGAEGGYRTNPDMAGKGGYSTGIVELKKGEKLYIYVGGAGGNGSSGCGSTICAGGFNGGGYRYQYYGGGGATDIRFVDGEWNNSKSLLSRLIVAGGGGSDGAVGKKGMYGGGATGGATTESYSSCGSYCGLGGTQTYSGYNESYTNTTQATTGLTSNDKTYYGGGFGFGGGGIYLSGGYGGAGGGGWYGGSGNAPDGSGDDDRGGGGGSGFIWNADAVSNVPSGYSIDAKYYLTEASTIGGNEAMPNYLDDTEIVGNSGDGFARITILNSAPAMIDLEVENATILEPIDFYRTEYRVEIPENNFNTNITVTTDRESYIIGDKNVTLVEGVAHPIVLMGTDGNLTVINLIPVINEPSLNNVTFDEVDIDFYPNIKTYDLTVPNHVTHLTPHVLKDDDISYEVVLLTELHVGNNQFKIIARNAAGKTSEYVFNVRRDFEKINKEYDYTGSVQTFVAPKAGIYQLEAWGAGGGRNRGDGSLTSSYSRDPGYGAYTKGNLYLEEGDTLYIYVGGRGADAITSTIVPGGWNGGGRGDYDHSDDEAAGGGGGATDFRLVSGEWDDFDSLKSRIMVAAGGGGAAYEHVGGYGGTLVGQSTLHATAGTQTSGYAFGKGQDGVYFASNIDIAGGGSGYYGGNSTYVSGRGSYQAAGAGGSSFVSGCVGCDAISEASTSTNIIHTGQANHYSGYVFNNITMLAGNEAMPSYTDNSNMTGNSGNGYARISYKGDASADKNLSNLTVTPGTLSPSFSPNVYEYNVSIEDIDTKVMVDASVNNINSLVNGTGLIEIPVGSYTHEVTLLDEVGNLTVYQLNFERQKNNYQFLDDILVNGLSISNFNPKTFEYDITIPYDLDLVNIEAVKNNEGQTVKEEGVYVLEDNSLTKVLFVVSEDGTQNQTYTLHLNKEKTSKLKKLTSVMGIDVNFQHNQTEYELELNKNILEVDFTAVPYYKGANVTITGNRFIEEDSVIEVISHVDGVEDSVYHIKIKQTDVANFDKDFSYTGEAEEFIVPFTGYYDVKLWGAAGGIGMVDGSLSRMPGEGSFTSGKILLHMGDILYIHVGGKGADAASVSRFTGGLGGYNGGGNGGNDTNQDSNPEPGGGGGGATDIRVVGGLWNNYQSLRSRIMVAAGASGGSYSYVGVPGGGLLGYKPSTSNNIATQTIGYALGAGQDGTHSSAGSSGAGGGYYGGYNVSGGYYSGGSGSSYISGHAGSIGTNEDGSPVVSEYQTISDSYNYTGKYFTETKMIDGSGYQWTTQKDRLELMPNPEGGYFASGHGNPGNGYASIKLLSILSSNNYLDSITINDGDIDINFEPWTLEYSIYLNEDETSLKVDATPKDEMATVSGTGTHKIAPYESVIPITVTSTDGTVKTYNINVYREPSTDATPANIKINKMTAYICSINASYCNYTFDPDQVLYNVMVPFAINKVELLAIPKSDWQEIIYRKYDGTEFVEIENGSVELVSGLNQFEVEVISESGENTVYTYNITRDPRGNTNISNIEVTNPAMDIDYQPLVYEYMISLGSEYSQVDFQVTPELSEAKVTISGNTNLGQGMNDAYIVVKAPNGETKTYIFHIYKEQDSNVFLNSIHVSNGSETYELNPVFDKYTNNYIVEVPNHVSSVDIAATTESSSASVSINNPSTLKSGVNQASITVSNGDAEPNVYQLSIVKQKGSNPNLLKIEAVGYTLDEAFDKNLTEYHLTIPKNVNKLSLKITPEESTTTYTIRGNNNLIQNVNQITITAIAENKTKKVYYLYVSKDISNNNNLSNIELSEGELSPEFDKNEINYRVSVPQEVDRITINGILEDTNARITGNGEHSLVTGDNEISLVVTSELGEEKTYTINVHRNASDDASLLKIENDQNSEVIKVSDTKYLINVQHEVKRITINGYPNDSKATISGNGTYDLTTGENKISLVVTSESGQVVVYEVVVVRDLSHNDDLSYLFAKEGALSPTFKDTTIYYDVYVDNSVNNLTLDIITEDKNASYEVIGNENFVIGENTVIVRVTAESGNTKDYVLNVIKQEASTEDLLLSDMEVVGQTISPDFSSYTYLYQLTVPNRVSKISLTGTAVDAKHKVLGIGEYDLRVGKNAVALSVVNEDGVRKDYQVIVTREKSSDATLSSLVIKGHTLSPTFNKNTYRYTIKTSLSELSFTTIKPTEEEATYKIIGNADFVSGDNIVTIRVTAPDGVTTQDYVLTVNRSKSKNNNLALLEVSGEELVPNFHKGVTFYAVTVANDINSVIVNAKAEDDAAKVQGAGLVKLNAGANQVNVVVTSENGTSKTYTILITREASTNNYLDNLFISEGSIDFNKDVSSYEIDVPYEVDEIGVSGDTEVNSSTVKGFGTHPLEVGRNVISVVVTSESGVDRTYTLTVNRAELISAKLKDLSVLNYELDTEFDEDFKEYYIHVPNEVFSVNITAIPKSSGATVEISGNENFVIGMNEVSIKVTSSDGLLEEIYTLYVNRQLSTNNKLLYLNTDRGELNPVFNPDTLSYTLDVANDVTDITLTAEAMDSTARITEGLGTHTLIPGENKILIKVSSITGIERTYIVNVNRAKSNNNYLSKLKVYDGTNLLNISPEFDKNMFSYELEVPYSITFVRLEGVLEDTKATLSGDGTKELTNEVNTYSLVVTAEDNTTKTYSIKITRNKNTNNNVVSIIPSTGEFTTTFDPKVKEYTLNVSESDLNLSFEVKTEVSFVQISGHESKIIQDNNNPRIITITAEDGSVNTYTIHVVQEKTTEARLDELTIAGYEFEFDPDTFSYNLNVSESKRKLLASEITAVAKDPKATVNLMGDLELENGMINIYTIEVIAEDGYTTQEYTLNITRDRNSKEYTLISKVYEIVRSDDFDYVIGILPNTKISEFQLNFQNEQSMLHVYREDGNLISDSDTLVGTGMIIKLESTDYVYDELRIIVRGDLTKDGKVNGADQVKLINYVGKASSLDSYQSLAADLTKDGKINGADQVKLINYVGKSITEIN